MNSVFLAWILGLNAIPAAPAVAAPLLQVRCPLDAQMNRVVETLNGYQGAALAEQFGNLLDENVMGLVWRGEQSIQFRGKQEFVDQYLNREVAADPGLRIKVGRSMTSGDYLIVFYQGWRTQPIPATWPGCDIYRLQGGKIVEARVQRDLNAVGRDPSSVDLSKTYTLFDQYYREHTTAMNRVGMGKLLDLKHSVVPAPERMHRLAEMLSPRAVQTSWEPRDIEYFGDAAAIRETFVDRLAAAVPDFYENVEQYLIAGNALILIQNPSGTRTLSGGSQQFTAWYNCDIYFFDEDKVSFLLFQRDVLLDERQGQAVIPTAALPEAAR